MPADADGGVYVQATLFAYAHGCGPRRGRHGWRLACVQPPRAGGVCVCVRVWEGAPRGGRRRGGSVGALTPIGVSASKIISCNFSFLGFSVVGISCFLKFILCYRLWQK